MGNITLRFNNGNTLIRHSPTGDSVLVSELGLHTEYELEVLRNKLSDEREAHEKALKVEREAHARTLAALSAICRTCSSQGTGRRKVTP